MRLLGLLLVFLRYTYGQNATGTEEGTESTVPLKDASSPEPPAALRIPRGTVYQIRPVNFQSEESPGPFEALDSISDYEFAKLKSRASASSSESSSSEPRKDDIDTSPSSNLKILNLNLDDSDAVETAGLPKFILAAAEAARRELDEGPREIVSESKNSNHARREPPPPHRHHHQTHNHRHEHPRPEHQIQSEEGADDPWDASYAFGYTLEDQSRHEVSDPSGNVKGYYQYVDDEGFIRKVVYTAGAGKGFMVLKKEKVRVSYPPPKKPHKHGNEIPPEYDFPSSPRPHPHPHPKPSRPPSPPRYPESPPPSDNDFSPPPQQPPRRGWGSKPPGRKQVYVVKIRKPRREEDDESGQYRDDSSEDNGQWDGDIGFGPVYNFKRKEGPPSPNGVESRPDPSYTFGYETEESNRLEKADKNGNVRGSYSYVDADGVKRSVHYSAGAQTGFQVLGHRQNQNKNHQVRIEAPPGFVVRHGTPTTSSSSNSAALSTAETEYPNPNVIVYHIHPDSNSINLSPWWEALGLTKRPRRMRRIMRLHKKRPRNFKKLEDEVELKAATEQSQTQEVPLLEEVSTTTVRIPQDNLENFVSHSDELSPSVASPSPSPPTPTRQTNAPRRQYFIRTRSDEVARRPFRHSTKVNLENMRMLFIRKRPSHRGFTQVETKNQFDSSDEKLDENARETLRNDPILYSPTHDGVQGRRRFAIPNPIILQPSSSKVMVRNRGHPTRTRLDAAESNLYSAFTTPSPGNGNDVFIATPTPDPSEIFSAGSLDNSNAGPDYGARDFVTSRSMQLSISSSTTKIPYLKRQDDPAINSVSLSSSSIIQNQNEGRDQQSYPSPSEESTVSFPTTAVPPNEDEDFPPPAESSSSSGTLALTEKDIEHAEGGVMSSSARLMQRLGVTPSSVSA